MFEATMPGLPDVADIAASAMMYIYIHCRPDTVWHHNQPLPTSKRVTFAMRAGAFTSADPRAQPSSCLFEFNPYLYVQYTSTTRWEVKLLGSA